MTDIRREVASPNHRVRKMKNVDPPSRFLLRFHLLCCGITGGKGEKSERGRLAKVRHLRRVGRLVNGWKLASGHRECLPNEDECFYFVSYGWHQPSYEFQGMNIALLISETRCTKFALEVEEEGDATEDEWIR